MNKYLFTLLGAQPIKVKVRCRVEANVGFFMLDIMFMSPLAQRTVESYGDYFLQWYVRVMSFLNLKKRKRFGWLGIRLIVFIAERISISVRK